MVLILQLGYLFIFSPDTLVIPRQIAIIPLQTLRFFGLFLLHLGNNLFVFSNLMIVQLLNAHSFFLRLINFIDELLLKINNLSLLDGQSLLLLPQPLILRVDRHPLRIEALLHLPHFRLLGLYTLLRRQLHLFDLHVDRVNF